MQGMTQPADGTTRGAAGSPLADPQALRSVTAFQTLFGAISQSHGLRDVFSAVQRLVAQIMPAACLQVWVWDDVKQFGWRVFSHQPAGTRDMHRDWGLRLPQRHALQELLRQPSPDVHAEWVPKEELDELACPGSHGLAYLRIPTSDGLPLLLTWCVPKDVHGDFSQLREQLVLLANAMVPVIEGARRRTEYELLSRVASLDWQRYSRREFFDVVADQVCGVLDAKGCSIFYHEAGPVPQLRLIGTTGLFDPETDRKLSQSELADLTYGPGEGLTGWILETLRPVRLFDARDSAEYREIDPPFRTSGNQYRDLFWRSGAQAR